MAFVRSLSASQSLILVKVVARLQWLTIVELLQLQKLHKVWSSNGKTLATTCVSNHGLFLRSFEKARCQLSTCSLDVEDYAQS